MDTQKLIVILLVVAIVFSVLSMIISLTASNIKLPEVNKSPKIFQGAGSDTNRGVIGLYVERNREAP